MRTSATTKSTWLSQFLSETRQQNGCKDLLSPMKVAEAQLAQWDWGRLSKHAAYSLSRFMIPWIHSFSWILCTKDATSIQHSIWAPIMCWHASDTGLIHTEVWSQYLNSNYILTFVPNTGITLVEVCSLDPRSFQHFRTDELCHLLIRCLLKTQPSSWNSGGGGGKL